MTNDHRHHYEWVVATSSFVWGALVGALVIDINFWAFVALVHCVAAVSLWCYWRLP